MEKEIEIQSVNEFLQTIYENSSGDEDQILWFRGECNNATPLVPSIYRILAKTFMPIKNDWFNSEHLKQLEKNLGSDFSRLALPFIISKGIENNGWNRYFLMQHYKIKTRLLDWTENALLALFFAIENSMTTNEDSKVWVLKPYLLNNFTINKILGTHKTFMIIPHGECSDKPASLLNTEGKVFIDELIRRYLKMDFDQGENNLVTNLYHPLAVLPFYLDQRMVSQKTCFTIFGNKINGLLSIESKDDFLYPITIGAQYKQRILNELALVGIDYSSAFPDLDGLGLTLNLKYQRLLNDDTESFIHVLNSSLQEKSKTPSS